MKVNNLLVLSIYDYGYTKSAMLNEEMLSDDKARKLELVYRKLDTDQFKTLIFRKYQCDLLICEDGNIEYYPYEFQKEDIIP